MNGALSINSYHQIDHFQITGREATLSLLYVMISVKPGYQVLKL
jgi:hypothetical protein